MTHSNHHQTRIQGDRPTYIQDDRRQGYPASRNQVTDRRQALSDREFELANQDLVNRNPSVGNGSRTASHNSYQNGYVQGRVAERRAYEDLRARDNNNASGGLLLGILLTSLLGLTVGTLFFVNQQSQAPVVPVPVPAEPETPSTETNNTEIRERVIERTRELVPIPQPQDPAPQQPVTEPAPAAPMSGTAQPEGAQPEVTQPEAAQPEVTEPAVPTVQPAESETVN
ncbi:MAG: hypothetical protein HC879_19820 [Leptolyngbyaceae cyanobacterium SL_5_9]|nr:hypothetical protein [Leptolyngbyaceae cyanobacterium SL_5_9]NJO73470.1 hypothetical protein [Leptolyngbyaceae cyanobacterium RM1_406_9]